MTFNHETFKEFSTSLQSSRFNCEGSDVEEAMYMIHTTDNRALFMDQLQGIVNTYSHIRWSEPQMLPVFIRIFLSDTANQGEPVAKAFSGERCPVSIIEQPPLGEGKIAMWIYSQKGVVIRHKEGKGFYSMEHSDYCHLWSADVANPETKGSKAQTMELLDDYRKLIAQHKCTLFSDTIRTWFFIQNVDVNYAGMVVGRNDIFDEEGLTPDKHFISSTGIQGRVASHDSFVMMDAYTVGGLKPGQIQFLYAPTHLNSTAEYGVRFERGTAVHYGDRSHVFISGTASIDNKGEVVYVGEIDKQTLRMWKNVEMLLAEADCDFGDIAQLIVYLRDISDMDLVREMFAERFPQTPTVFVLAPVCRPQWLIEMECIAIRKNNNPEYAPY
ncbi:MAG: Rid family hydrolase [Rikenellaceae bacterium]